MPRVAGVATHKNTKGEITHVTFNLKKHKNTILPIMEELGVVQKSKFMQEFEKGIPLEEAKRQTLNYVRSLPWKK